MPTTTDTIKAGLAVGSCYRYPTTDETGTRLVKVVAMGGTAGLVHFRGLDPRTLGETGTTLAATPETFSYRVFVGIEIESGAGAWS